MSLADIGVSSSCVDTAPKWTCDRCGVSVSRIDGSPAPLPESWSAVNGCFCLTCRRERAAEAALATAPTGCDAGERAKLRRAGLVEFEVLRVPDHADNVIAKACHTSASAVARARDAVGQR